MRMPNVVRLTVASLLASLLSATLCLGQVGRAPTTTSQGVELKLPSEAAVDAAPPRPRRVVNPLYPKILALLEAERSQLVTLSARLAATRDGDAAMAIQREIEQVKTGTELSILRLQAEQARARGSVAVADRLDAAIRQMLQPAPRLRPVERPAPVNASTTNSSR